MKTTLTLNSGSFYFLSTISLLRGQPQEVDVSTLTLSEKRNLLSHIASGNITSTEDIGDVVCDLVVEEKQEKEESDDEEEEEADAEDPQELSMDDPGEEDELEELEEEAEDSEIQDKYTSMTKKELRAEIKKRGLTEKGTRNDQLRAVLREADKQPA